MAYILLLEPNQVLAHQYQQYLEARGHDLAHLTDAQAAIIAADKARPDIVIVELLLAGHSGVEFLYELRSYAEWQSIPIVLLSRVAAADSGIDDRLLGELGVVSYLYKPNTSLKKLAATIEKALA